MKMGLPVSVAILLAVISLSKSQEICNIYCDGRDPDLAPNTRVPVTVTIFSREISLRISDVDNMAYGTIENGDPGDELWLDRSFDGGVSWAGGERLGDTQIPPGARGWRTLLFNVDNPSVQIGIGALRACGKAADRPEIACTGWARSTVNAERPVDAAATALMQFYDDRGLWKTTGWWNAANCLTAILDYSRVTGKTTYQYAIDNTFEKNKNMEDGNFTNIYIDDTLWWGLAWVNAYDLLGDQKYLEMAMIDADYCFQYHDYICGGGVWWTRDRGYKNAITNELYIKLTAALHNRIPGDTKYLHRAIENWIWFRSSGMFNEGNLINDGLNNDCQNNRDVEWSYNQGVILGGLVELNKATGDQNYLDEARRITDAVINSNSLNPDGILTDYGCGGGDCGGDGPSFKGVFVRNLGELDRVLPNRPYQGWLRNQEEANYQRNRNSLDQYGLRWAGPLDKIDGSRQHSALEAFTAAF